MTSLRARVENGRLILNEPTDLPEGMTLDLVIDDEGDDLSPEERQALHDFLERSLKSAESGELHLASDVLEELRKRRR
ncbi:MAG: hypothetical protein WAW96_12100 [Alphaproteobacteria bacterium]